MKLLFTLILYLAYINASAQKMHTTTGAHDSIDLSIATQYLNKKLGADYVQAHLKYVGHYQSVLHMITFEIMPNLNNKNLIIISINDEEVESKHNSKIELNDINLYKQGRPSPNIFYNKCYAFEQAKKANLSKGIKEWGIEIDGVADKVSWVVSSYTEEQYDPIWSAHGKCVDIDIRTGKANLRSWRGIE
ncbi:hypothetical protein [Hymenobacter sp. GOD-10R]|uniref:hypothetical protein n=1 Tax=Hymenobacter sp. GOD-10R TaxID=3093922 RepID=UPI002D774B3C|nr:hypothetical protein [Hymenobacter sp. GOD-10R]WRQ26389.1 hypothetical protein SD425_15015 [Hymenobacter sp. GOD-10R]